METLKGFALLCCLIIGVGHLAIISAVGAEAGVAGALPEFEGTVHCFPAMFDSAGRKMADGEFMQWLEGERLHVKIVYDYGKGHHIEENDIFRQRPILVQDEWSWEEVNGGRIDRRFRIHFEEGKAEAEKLQEKGPQRWTESVKVERGRTFAGFGFALAIKAARTRLVGGQRIELGAVGFLPKPRAVDVEISYGGMDEMEMGQRTVRGERFVIHPKVPALARAFIDVHDTGIWLTLSPHSFLRWEGPLLEPSDRIVRVDLLPGQHSGAAVPVRQAKAPER